MNFDSEDFRKEFVPLLPEIGGNRGIYIESIDEILTNFVLLFVASDMARYRPQL